MWALDGDKPVLAAKQLCRVIIRYFKGHGNSYQLDEVSAGPGHGLCRAGLGRLSSRLVSPAGKDTA